MSHLIGTATVLEGSVAATGTGSPEGVLSANVGAMYIDQDATAGAVQWVKASGVGPTGWRVVYGDTGWRTLAAWDAAGVYSVGSLKPDFAPRAGTAGSVRIRRVNERVDLQINNVQAAAALAIGVLYPLTPDLDPTLYPLAFALFSQPQAGGMPGYMGRNSGAAVNIVPGASRAIGEVIFNANFWYSSYAPHSSAWPSSLPGIAS